jgi:hypothetical protein
MLGTRSGSHDHEKLVCGLKVCINMRCLYTKLQESDFARRRSHTRSTVASQYN